jgi:hypothetical protein
MWFGSVVVIQDMEQFTDIQFTVADPQVITLGMVIETAVGTMIHI